ncbi:MAG: helix-turn-helix domain-containing protein [Lachnospiraceae bacterium]|nr:helix-turn-helix domain-containing protein [Lachnospiraceae bacterium]
MLYDILKETYGENEPIFIADIQYEGMSMNFIRQQIKKLTDAGLLRRYDTGIYFIPKKSFFKSGSQLSRDTVIERKYLKDDGCRCGYIGGVMFANQLGLTTQVPMICEIVTNKATNDYREVRLASSSLILKKPRVRITEENFRQLQLLDLLKDIDFYAEKDKAEQLSRIMAYMEAYQIHFQDLEAHMRYYPDRIYRNMYEMGLLSGISA